MNDRPAADLDDEIPGEVARLRNAIACELHAQLALRGEAINLSDVPGVAYAVAVQLGHAFRIEWAPRWADERDDDEFLSVDAAVFYGSSMPSGDGGRSSDRFPIFDRGWPSRL